MNVEGELLNNCLACSEVTKLAMPQAAQPGILFLIITLPLARPDQRHPMFK